MNCKVSRLVGGSLGLAAGLLSYLGGAIAAETVRLTYGPVSMDIPIAELEEFAETGEPSRELERLFDLANQDPERVRSTLNEPVDVNPVALDMVLNSPVGEWMLDRVSDTIHPASGQAGRLALRAALIGSAAEDNEITLLEIMQTYPTPEIVVRGDRLLETYNRVNDVLEPLQELADVFQDIADVLEEVE